MQGKVEKTTMYAVGGKKQILEWAIWAEDYVMIMEHGQQGGQKQKKTEKILEGLAGRTRDEQLISRINSRINKKLDNGYVFNADDAVKNGKKKNILGMPKPMKAKVYWDNEDRIDWTKNFYVQPKFNGHRCLIAKRNGEVFAYSANGKLIQSIDHIIDELSDKIDEDEIIDGELYHHGSKVQTISSWVKRKQEDSKKLKFFVYDKVSNKGFVERFSELTNTNNLDLCENIELSETIAVESHDDLIKHLDQFISDDYEGAMLRQDCIPYEDAKRSKQIYKVKKFFDDEFKVVDIIASSDGWAILVCECESGTVKASAPGSLFEREIVLKQKEKYIGKWITLKYSEFTEDGKPFHPVAERWRNKEDE